jgi:hypothetical protein
MVSSLARASTNDVHAVRSVALIDINNGFADVIFFLILRLVPRLLYLPLTRTWLTRFPDYIYIDSTTTVSLDTDAGFTMALEGILSACGPNDHVLDMAFFSSRTCR